jgi:hypothetical protein
MKIYNYPAEIWDAKTCEKKAKHLATDGLGTKYPFRGYIGSSASRPTAYGTETYNGGIVINNEWYNGTNRPLPIVANGFKIVVVPTWGWRIVKL